MAKSLSKIYQRTALVVLVIIISGLLNVCLFAFQAKAAVAQYQSPIFNFAYDSGDNCLSEPRPESSQNIHRPAAPIPQCCLTQNRNFNTVVNTANNQPAPSFAGLVISALANQNFENNSTHYTPRLTSSPPEALALAAIVIRE